MKFEAVDPNDINNLREGRRGRVSYPILKGFMETNLPLAKLDRTGIQQSMQTLTSCLTSYIRNHKLPVKLFTRGGHLYLMRLDLKEDGSVNEQYIPGQNEIIPEDAPAITDAEVDTRFQTEKNLVTK